MAIAFSRFSDLGDGEHGRGSVDPGKTDFDSDRLVSDGRIHRYEKRRRPTPLGEGLQVRSTKLGQQSTD
jgi:hypothetical protein